MGYPISLVCISHNGASRIKKLVENHKDVVAEVIIVDQGSTDNTYEEAAKYADKVFRRRCKGAVEPDRNWAFALATQPYVLYLDDDESLSEPTKKALPEILATGGDIFWFNRQNLVDGIDIAEVLGDDPQCRLFRSGSLRFPDRLHQYPSPAIDTKIFFLEHTIVHERTLEGLKASNRAREVVADPGTKKMQDDFIVAVETLLKEKDGFTDNWYSSAQLDELKKAVRKTKDLKGLNIEIGCWEGKSACTFANEVYPETVFAVDTWQGNIAEGENHPSVIKAKERDVYSAFLENVKSRTKGNVVVFRMDCFEFLEKNISEPVKFCHIDAAHDYESVKRAIEMLKPHLVKGAVLCGDDFAHASADRSDLNGGVERAVKECCPGFYSVDNFWIWVNK